MKGVIVSNGLGRFPLADAAAEFARIGQLDGLVVGGYPKRAIRSVGRLGRRSDRFVRLLDRGKPIPDSVVKSCWGPEILGQAASGLRTLKLESLPGWLDVAAFRTFAWHSRNRLRRASNSDVFLYRSGFGLSAVAEARRRGMLTVCYHSIAHPNVLWRLLGRDGQLPPPWPLVLADLSLADAVVVEGDFVKETFLDEGWPASRLRVVYEGVDDQFLEQVAGRRPLSAGAPLQLLFVGSFGRRKGAEDLVLALEGLSDVDWRLTIVGAVEPDSRTRFRQFLARSDVAAVGTVRRSEVAARMAFADVFVFPTLAEGSARAVFEALASGCYVITTRNAGSIVEDGVNGDIVPIHAPEAIADAIRRAASDRQGIRAIGAANAQLVRREYRQAQFARTLWDVLCELHARYCLNEAAVDHVELNRSLYTEAQ